MTEHREKPATGFPEPPGHDPEDRSRDPEPHHVLSNPVGEPDPTEWPDPYEQRPDPRDPGSEGAEEEPHTVPGSMSTSAPNPKQDPEAEPWAEGPKRDKIDR
ncbi:MAG: hypothetical protein ACJ764_05425 [Solirubrobacteraceae bacterium]